MLKTGIYSIDQLNDPKNFKTIFGNDKKFSITLYPEIVKDPEKSDLAEQILLNFTDDRGAFKRTYANRFEKFDSEALKEIQVRFSPDNPLIVHDTAISDGRTACDFFEKLKPHFPSLSYYASDYDPYLYVLEEGRTKIVMNRDNKFLEITFPPFVFNGTRESRRHPLNGVLRFILKQTTVRKMILKYKKKILKSRECLLFCPQAIELAYQDSRFHLLQHNILHESSLSSQVHIFRAMNILNPGYFNNKEVEKIISCAFNSLLENGLLIIGSNQNSNTTVHGGIFQKINRKFETVWKSGDGASIEDLIMNFKQD
jgi:hypothetical protein